MHDKFIIISPAQNPRQLEFSCVRAKTYGKRISCHPAVVLVAQTQAELSPPHAQAKTLTDPI